MPRTHTRISDVSHTPAPSSPGVGDRGNDTTPPFFNTTYSIHRVSPLFIGTQSLDAVRLAVLGRRLRDTLVGDVVRGIQIGLESTSTPVGQVGSLRSVKIRWFQADDLLGDGEQVSEAAKQERGLWIDIRHENAAYTALLLPRTSSSASASRGDWAMQPDGPATGVSDGNPQFLHLPLMLMRMPLALKQVISDWLSTTFDCRVNKLTLGTKSIVDAWEGWLEDVGVPQKGPDVVISLAFNAPLIEHPSPGNKEGVPDSDEPVANPGLRSIDITISPQDLRRFVRIGKAHPSEPVRVSGLWENDARERRRLAGGNPDDGWAWRSAEGRPDQPFTDALARYLDHHLALNLFHPSVRITQVSCAGFVLAQSRIKIARAESNLSDTVSNAAWRFVKQLGERVHRSDLPSIF